MSLSHIIRPAAQDEVPALRAMTKGSFPFTRFSIDPGFPRAKSELLYELWVDKACSEPSTSVLVAESAGQPTGFVAIECPKGSTIARIGLICVGDGHRGSGIGRALVSAALSLAHERAYTSIAVATQARNTGAIRLYEHADFALSEMRQWYHKWY